MRGRSTGARAPDAKPSAAPGIATDAHAGLGDLVVIGASWGGLHAVGTVLRALPPEFTTPIAVVQHRAKESDGLLAQLLQETTSLTVRDVEDKEPIAPGHVYLAPPDYHLLVEEEHFALSVEAAVRYSRPSIDVTFVSAAESRGPAVLAVVLTGANDDGARGARRVVDRGGRAVVQDPKTAEVRTMPEAAIRHLRGAPPGRCAVVALEQLGEHLAAVAGNGLGAHP